MKQPGPFTEDELTGLRTACGDALDALQTARLKRQSNQNMIEAAGYLADLMDELDAIAKATNTQGGER